MGNHRKSVDVVREGVGSLVAAAPGADVDDAQAMANIIRKGV
jgi:hypothetical protein